MDCARAPELDARKKIVLSLSILLDVLEAGRYNVITMLTPTGRLTKTAKARFVTLGREAFKAGKDRAPAMHPEFEPARMCNELPSSKARIDAMRSFLHGWDAANLAAKI